MPRPKLKRKHVKKPKPPLLTPDELAARRMAMTERRHKITPQKVNTAIINARGLLTDVCRKLKIPRSTLLRYIEKHDVCIETLGQARDEMGDIAEKKLFELIERGDVRCLLYYLSTVHRHRGYGLNNSDAPENNQGRGPVFVETVNIVGVPPGTYLPPPPPDQARDDSMVVEHQP